MARFGMNHIRVTLFWKKGQWSIARLFTRGDVKGGAWITVGSEGQAGWAGFWASTAGAVDRLIAESEKDRQKED